MVLKDVLTCEHLKNGRILLQFTKRANSFLFGFLSCQMPAHQKGNHTCLSCIIFPFFTVQVETNRLTSSCCDSEASEIGLSYSACEIAHNGLQFIERSFQNYCLVLLKTSLSVDYLSQGVIVFQSSCFCMFSNTGAWPRKHYRA